MPEQRKRRRGEEERGTGKKEGERNGEWDNEDENADARGREEEKECDDQRWMSNGMTETKNKNEIKKQMKKE